MPSFFLYNISMGIHTTECAAWFTRWVQCQNFTIARSVVFWEAVGKPPQSRLFDYFTAGCVSVCSTGFLLTMAILSYDMYGVANACGLIVSVLTRAYILSANRMEIDKAVLNSKARKNTEKLIFITPDTKVITLFIPNELIVPVFVKNPHPSPRLPYQIGRWMSWLAFGIHVVTVGMASLAIQIYTIGLLLISSILITRGFGCDDKVRPVSVKFDGGGETRAYTCTIGSYLKATVFEWPSFLDFEEISESTWQFCKRPAKDPAKRSTRRMDLYAWLNLTAEEEESFSKWNLLPHKRGDNPSWENAFNAKKALIRRRSPNILQIKKRVEQAIEFNSTSLKPQDGADVEGQISDSGENTLRHPQRVQSTKTTDGGVKGNH
ncbi:uncharacterized protein N7496_002852 [Penicillium cataractarum]|uniref:Uncharacterized protein n=1 Tax=Penicillium cataractarum TaxID=2100454 RepID=A0A9W9VGY5_9EURO|nr:uncharacterized protein N7496_002852 [Penicillium cataractarum]KAJ5380424.1 hypothetical protein N7496_002852 [Penicillium cataractarum]